MEHQPQTTTTLLNEMVLGTRVKQERSLPSPKAVAKEQTRRFFGKPLDATMGTGVTALKAPIKGVTLGAKMGAKKLYDAITPNGSSEFGLGGIDAFGPDVERGEAIGIDPALMSVQLESVEGEMKYDSFRPEPGSGEGFKNIHALAHVNEGADVSAEVLGAFNHDLSVNLDVLGHEDHRLPLEELEGMLGAAVKRALDKHELHGKVSASAMMVSLFDKPVETEEGPVSGPWAIIANYGENEVIYEDEHEIAAITTDDGQVGTVTAIPLVSVDKIWLSNYNEHNQDTDHSYFEFTINRGSSPAEEGRDWSRVRRIAGIVGGAMVAGAVTGVAARGEDRFNFPAAGLAAGAAGVLGSLLESRRNRHDPSVATGDISHAIDSIKKGINQYDIANNKDVWKSLSHDEQKQYSNIVKQLSDFKEKNPDTYLDNPEYKSLYVKYRRMIAPIIERNRDTKVAISSEEAAQAQHRLNVLLAEKREANNKRTFFGLGEKRKARAVAEVEARYFAAWSETLGQLTPEYRVKLSRRAKIAVGVGVTGVGVAAAIALSKDRLPEGVRGKAGELVQKAKDASGTVRETAAKGAELYGRVKASGVAGRAVKGLKGAGSKAAVAVKARRSVS